MELTDHVLIWTVMLVEIHRADANGDNEGGGQASTTQIQSQMFEAIHAITV